MFHFIAFGLVSKLVNLSVFTQTRTNCGGGTATARAPVPEHSVLSVKSSVLNTKAIDLLGGCIMQLVSDVRSVLAIKCAHLHKHRHAHMPAMCCRGTPQSQDCKEKHILAVRPSREESGSWLLTDVYPAFPGNCLCFIEEALGSYKDLLQATTTTPTLCQCAHTCLPASIVSVFRVNSPLKADVEDCKFLTARLWTLSIFALFDFHVFVLGVCVCVRVCVCVWVCMCVCNRQKKRVSECKKNSKYYGSQ